MAPIYVNIGGGKVTKLVSVGLIVTKWCENSYGTFKTNVRSLVRFVLLFVIFHTNIQHINQIE